MKINFLKEKTGVDSYMSYNGEYKVQSLVSKNDYITQKSRIKYFLCKLACLIDFNDIKLFGVILCLEVQ